MIKTILETILNEEQFTIKDIKNKDLLKFVKRNIKKLPEETQKENLIWRAIFLQKLLSFFEKNMDSEKKVIDNGDKLFIILDDVKKAKSVTIYFPIIKNKSQYGIFFQDIIPNHINKDIEIYTSNQIENNLKLPTQIPEMFKFVSENFKKFLRGELEKAILGWEK